MCEERERSIKRRQKPNYEVERKKFERGEIRDVSKCLSERKIEEKSTDIFELKEAKVAEVGDSAVSGFDGDDELNQLHRLRTEQIHRRATTTTRYFSHSLSLLRNLSKTDDRSQSQLSTTASERPSPSLSHPRFISLSLSIIISFSNQSLASNSFTYSRSFLV